MTRLWKQQASDQGRHSSTLLTACSSADLPSASTLSSHEVTIWVKQVRNFDSPIVSQVTSSPYSSFATVCGHSSVFFTGLCLTLDPDFTCFFLLCLLFGLLAIALAPTSELELELELELGLELELES